MTSQIITWKILYIVLKIIWAHTLENMTHTVTTTKKGICVLLLLLNAVLVKGTDDFVVFNFKKWIMHQAFIKGNLMHLSIYVMTWHIDIHGIFFFGIFLLKKHTGETWPFNECETVHKYITQTSFGLLRCHCGLMAFT